MSDATALLLERTFEAPADLVWLMWTDVEHFRRWYGPLGARIPEARLDVRVGGERRVCMEMDTPGGVMRMWFTGEHLEVDPPRLLVYTEAMTDESGSGGPAVTTVRVELEELGGRTLMRLTHEGIAPDSPGASGWGTALDKLAAELPGAVD